MCTFTQHQKNQPCFTRICNLVSWQGGQLNRWSEEASSHSTDFVPHWPGRYWPSQLPADVEHLNRLMRAVVAQCGTHLSGEKHQNMGLIILGLYKTCCPHNNTFSTVQFPNMLQFVSEPEWGSVCLCPSGRILDSQPCSKLQYHWVMTPVTFYQPNLMFSGLS